MGSTKFTEYRSNMSFHSGLALVNLFNLLQLQNVSFFTVLYSAYFKKLLKVYEYPCFSRTNG